MACVDRAAAALISTSDAVSRCGLAAAGRLASRTPTLPGGYRYGLTRRLVLARRGRTTYENYRSLISRCFAWAFLPLQRLLSSCHALAGWLSSTQRGIAVLCQPLCVYSQPL